jgi:hypothetical protein
MSAVLDELPSIILTERAKCVTWLEEILRLEFPRGIMLYPYLVA